MNNLFLNRYPYTDFHELNLSWLIQVITEVQKTLEDFVAINALKYADPIQWNITTQYEKNTIVIDPVSGVAYISVQPVPSGVALTNTDYWTVVFDLGQFVVRASKNFSINYEVDTTTSATFASNAGDWLVWGDTLYKALVNITPGDTYVVNGNIQHFTMEELVGHLDNLTTADKTSIVNAINELLTTIGDLTTLTTSDQTSIVNAINSLVTVVGDLANLSTTDQSSIVNAINEVVSNIGDLSNLTTTDKSNAVNAINEINEHFSNLHIVNVLDYGAVGDGITDDTQAFQAAITKAASNGYAVYIPSGDYLISDTINVVYSVPFAIFGAGDSSRILHTTNNDIFSFTNLTVLCSFKNFRITSTTIAKTTASAFVFNNGCNKIIFNNIRYDLDNEGAGNSMHFPKTFFKCDGSSSCDTIAFIDCYLEHIDGKAIILGAGSSIWLTGGRIVGTNFDLDRPGSTGVYCSGDIGGVYIVSTDLIWLDYGLYLSNDNGSPNREFFITNTTFDGDKSAITVDDGANSGTYLDLNGCWICTSNNLGIYVPATCNPIMKIVNCIFDMVGTHGSAGIGSYAVNINGGQVTIATCRFANNAGTALYINSPLFVSVVSDCDFGDNYNNGTIAGNVVLKNNVFRSGTLTRGDYNSSLYGNIGLSRVTTPTLPASGVGVANDTGKTILVVVETTDTVDVYVDNVLQNVKTVVLYPNQPISLSYVNAPSAWQWYEIM